MTALELPPRLEWTADALQQLPDDFRYEVREGNLVVMSAAAGPWHARVEWRICSLLEAQGREAYIGQGLLLAEGEIRTCDVGVYAAPPAGDASYRPASDFVLLVEVVSPHSRREDREVKPKLYAAAGVPEYWRVEEASDGSAEVHRFRLDAGSTEYREDDVVELTALE